jgi:hypothetical protein
VADKCVNADVLRAGSRPAEARLCRDAGRFRPVAFLPFASADRSRLGGHLARFGAGRRQRRRRATVHGTPGFTLFRPEPPTSRGDRQLRCFPGRR